MRCGEKNSLPSHLWVLEFSHWEKKNRTLHFFFISLFWFITAVHSCSFWLFFVDFCCHKFLLSSLLFSFLSPLDLVFSLVQLLFFLSDSHNHHHCLLSLVIYTTLIVCNQFGLRERKKKKTKICIFDWKRKWKNHVVFIDFPLISWNRFDDHCFFFFWHFFLV